ncbi:MAG: CDP-diacylglycerol O-phosphatidyltransferase [Acidobacteria bacterium]|nr:CDP-diacylglycerol O-phosphatidyltransferase [Acidobacteriota bacterium]
MTAWLVHLYTASSALFGFLALTRIFYDRYREAFFWIAVTIAIDATDGLLARRARVASRLPHFDGAKLDDIVDYITYVFVPAFFVWHALLVPDRWSMLAAAAMLLASAYGFNRDDAKTTDYFYTGFPSYWNIVVFYLYVAGWSPAVNLLILLLLAAFVCVPIRYVYPSRTPVWRSLTVALGLVWGALMLVLLWQLPDVSRPVLWVSLVFPAYYLVLSLALDRRRARA